MTTTRTVAALLAFGLFGAPERSLLAQAPAAAPEQAEPLPSGQGSVSQPNTQPSPPKAPADRLAEAQRAYNLGQYQKLVPLLEPSLLPDSAFVDPALELQARELFAVGLFFEAQQTPLPAARRDLLDRTQAQFLALLRRNPDHQINPLNFPASVVEVFESVREEHADELNALRPEEGQPAYSETFYVEREITNRPFLVNFLPFGIGQFQNGHTLGGTLFAVGQGSMLILNGAAYAGIRLADLDRDGTYLRAGIGSEYAVASAWRNVMWGALAGFSVIYIWSVVDAIVRYEASDIRIRSLDEPPPELAGRPPRDAPPLALGVGSVTVRW